MNESNLPTYPQKGQRRALDQDWLVALHAQGLAAFLREVPEIPNAMGQAIDEFNQGQYWQCHETLEAIWLPERYPLRLFYHGLIKAAVGLLHLQRGNRHGALVKLRDAEFTLEPFTPEFLRIDTGKLTGDIKERLNLVQPETTPDWKAIQELPPVQIWPL